MENKNMVTRFTFESTLDLIDFSCMILFLTNKGYTIEGYELSQDEQYMKVFFYEKEVDSYIKLYNDTITIKKMSARESLELYEDLLKCRYIRVGEE